MKFKTYLKLIKIIYSHKTVLVSYFAGALIGYLITSFFNNKEFMDIVYLVYYFAFISLSNANIYLFNRWRRKQTKKRLIQGLKQRNLHKVKFFNQDGFLGEIDSDKYAIALYKVKSNDFLLFKQLLNLPLVLLRTITLGVQQIPITLVTLGLFLSYYSDVSISQLTIGEILSKDILYFILKINLILVIPIWIFKYKVMPGYVNYRARELTNLLSAHLPILSTSSGWYCYSGNEIISEPVALTSE